MNASKTILIVDDEKVLCDAIAFDFKRKGYNVLCAYNGGDAFKIVQSQPVDLILSDVRMPNGDGVELLTNVKNHNYAIPIVMFITGFADLTLEQAYDMGVDAVFAKPFNRKELISAVADALVDDEVKWCRGGERVEVDAEIKLHLADFDKAISGRVINIGRGGIFVAMDEDPPVPLTKVRFSIKFDSATLSLIEGDGIVRWSRAVTEGERRKGCGIEFLTLNEEAKIKFTRWLKVMKTKAFIPKT